MTEPLPIVTAKAGRRSDQVTEALKRYILVHRLAPGTRLPTERRLALALVVGRNAVREALNSLVALGIVEKRHGSGIYVREFNPDGLAEQLSYGLREDAAYWLHLFEARVELETAVSRLAARRITEDQLSRLRTLFESMRRQVECGQSHVQADVAFHLELLASGGNPVLERLGRAVIAEYFRYTSSLDLGTSLVGDPQTILNHEPLLAGLVARDPSASGEAMRFHFRQIRGHIEAATEITQPGLAAR